MARVKLTIPEEKPIFSTTIDIHVNHVNYGGHMGNDAVLTIAHESRIQWLKSHKMTELKTTNGGLIMVEAVINYRNEGFHGDKLLIDIYSSDVTSRSFDLIFDIYKILNKKIPVAVVRTGMLCFDYSTRRQVNISNKLAFALQTQNH